MVSVIVAAAGAVTVVNGPPAGAHDQPVGQSDASMVIVPG
jgi:hypothetical protein